MTDAGASADRLEELFARVVAASPASRRELVEELTRDCPALREELESLLEVSGDADSFFEELSGEIAETAPRELDRATRPKALIGPYRVEEAVGHGGMGVVYRARRADGAFDQVVAVKLLHLDMHRPEIQKRFLAERQLLAQLEHPHIARLLDGGVTDEGRPYIVMEYIDGLPITTYCRQRGLTHEQMLRLFLQAVDAVSYLHRNLVVHRDIKPSNLLVTRSGLVKLLDFGIAKILSQEDDAALTKTVEQLLTPQYAAPEQLRGSAVTTAADVFSLGGVLFELLSGEPSRQRAREPLALLADEGPEPPSRRLDEVRRERDPEARPSTGAGHGIPSDLDTVCLMAMRPESERRYASADQLGEDIERFLGGLPVRARPSTLGYRLGKFVARHRLAVAVAVAVPLLLGLGFYRERGLRSRAELEASRAAAISQLIANVITSADPAVARGADVTVSEVLDNAEKELDELGTLANQPIVEASVRTVLGKTRSALGQVDRSRLQLQRALELAGGEESDDPVALEAAVALAAVGGDEAEQERLLRHALAALQRTPSLPATLEVEALVALSRLLRAQARYVEAELQSRRAVDLSTRLVGQETRPALIAENALAGVLFETARYSEAAALYADGLKIARRILGPGHPDTVRFMANLAAAYGVLGRYAEAEPLERAVVREHVRLLGEEHHRTGMSLHNLGELLGRRGRWEESEAVLRRALRARTRIGGAAYFYTKSFLADAIKERGRLDEAEALYVETLAEQEEQLQRGHPDTLRTRSALADLRFRQSRFEEAESLASEVLDRQLALSGAKRLDAVETLELLARLRARRGDAEHAEILLRRALALREEVFPPEHPLVRASREALARLGEAGVLESAGRSGQVARGR